MLSTNANLKNKTNSKVKQEMNYLNLYYTINELIKSYYIFSRFDPVKANEILERLNRYRLQLVTLAAQRQIFIEQLTIEANASGYKNDVFFTHDDIDSLVSKFIAWLGNGTTISLVHQGTRENLFTRQPVAWQQLMSESQLVATNGQQIPFDLPQEIFLGKSQTLDIGVTNQTSEGLVFVHGANLIDNRENVDQLIAEINGVEFNGMPNIPKPQLIPIQFKFESEDLDSPAVAVDGGDNILSVKNEKSVILTDISCTSLDFKMSLEDKGRNMTIATNVEASGISALVTNQYTGYYPLPYPHLLRAKDRIQLRGLNVSAISSNPTPTNVVQTLVFRGFTI